VGSRVRPTWDGHPDGSFTLDRETFPAASNVLGCSVVGFLAGLVVRATVGDMLGGAGTVAALASAGVGEDFISEVTGLMKPGPSAILVLDDEGDMDVILHRIRGLGGNGVEDQRGSGAGTADPVHPGRAFDTKKQIGKQVIDS
jgi:uncharacterized membrane protein